MTELLGRPPPTLKIPNKKDITMQKEIGDIIYPDRWRGIVLLFDFNGMKSQIPPKPPAPQQIEQNPNSLGSIVHGTLLGCLILVFILAVSTTLVLAYYIYQPQIHAYLQIPTKIQIPTETPPCDKPAMKIGPYIFPLDVVMVSQERTLPTIPGPANTAWWVSGTNNPYVVIFVPAVRSIDLKAVLESGDQFVMQSANCSLQEFMYTNFDSNPSDPNALLDQTNPGVAVIVQPAGNRTEYVLYGQRVEPGNPSTPEPSP